ncbi:hypothetical protein CLV47_12536 [Antricoccus suffuscus]|uniref:EamA-like transporter family protein n=1 Tax=Antricoccus suffuscus TaxID=1629062 RepID=A0A2T0ZB57_9ACTN|nr:hypothetical protein [Antricoccus suffuscus]PRZ33579.1 hypothetical protein CLV47_12536 [Antricoccus suffuscus]
MIIGLLCAFGGAVAMGVASILQSISAKRSAALSTIHAGRIVRLIGHPMYVAGIALDLVGAVAALIALQHLPIFLVQSALASSVAITALIAAFLGSRIRRAEWLALGALAVGLILLALAAAPAPSSPLAGHWNWVMLAAAIPVVALAGIGVRAADRRAGVILAVAGGLSFSIVAIAARTLSMSAPLWHLLAAPALWVIVVHGILATVMFAMALQRGSVTSVTALTFGTEVLIPSAIGLAFLGDAARSGFAAAAAAGFVLAIVGALALARFSEPDLNTGRTNVVPT